MQRESYQTRRVYDGWAADCAPLYPPSKNKTHKTRLRIKPTKEFIIRRMHLTIMQNQGAMQSENKLVPTG